MSVVSTGNGKDLSNQLALFTRWDFFCHRCYLELLARHCNGDSGPRDVRVLTRTWSRISGLRIVSHFLSLTCHGTDECMMKFIDTFEPISSPMNGVPSRCPWVFLKFESNFTDQPGWLHCSSWFLDRNQTHKPVWASPWRIKSYWEIALPRRLDDRNIRLAQREPAKATGSQVPPQALLSWRSWG